MLFDNSLNGPFSSFCCDLSNRQKFGLHELCIKVAFRKKNFVKGVIRKDIVIRKISLKANILLARRRRRVTWKHYTVVPEIINNIIVEFV